MSLYAVLFVELINNQQVRVTLTYREGIDVKSDKIYSLKWVLSH